MNKVNTQQESDVMALVRVLGNGQITLPAEAREALHLNAGDYLDLQVTDGVATLKPVAAIDREQAWRKVREAQASVRYIGPEPEPSDDELMDMVNEEVHELRAEHAKSGSR
jgi:AbrB family looped-hinge helix DNA binding protein